ncbi:MAG: ion channel [Pyrinomonadaceae bacterium]
MLNQFSDKNTQAADFVQQVNRDLGFGSVVARESRQRLLNQDGSFNVHRKGLSGFAMRNFYHWLLTMPWWEFLGFVVALYLGINIAFAIVFLLCGADALADTSVKPIQNLFLRSFFFSVQTFGTIGYGIIAPVGTIANVFVTIESIISILLQALVTGMFFARFSRPTAQIRFSSKLIITPFQDTTALMFRLVNMRTSQLIEVGAQVLFTRFIEENGRITRRFDLLPLEREKVSFLPLAWTVVHPIDRASPLYGLTDEDLKESDAEILILLTAIEEDFAQIVHSRSSYKPDEIAWNAKFVNLYNKTETGEPISIDVRKLSEFEKI